MRAIYAVRMPASDWKLAIRMARQAPVLGSYLSELAREGDHPGIAMCNLQSFIEKEQECGRSHLLGDISELRTKFDLLLVQLNMSSASTTSKESQNMEDQAEESVTSVEAHCLSTLSNTELATEALTCFALLLTREQGWEYLLDLRSKLEELCLDQVKRDFKAWSETSEVLRLRSEVWMRRCSQFKESESGT